MAAYKLHGHLKFQGLDISIENRKGSVRTWKDPHGKESGSTRMFFAYGYIKKTKGTDGDHVDVYIGPSKDATHAFVIDQNKKPPGDIKKDGKAWTEFDEQKIMLGFPSEKEAKAAYLKQYDDPRFFRSMKPMLMSEFKEKVLMRENHGKKVAHRFLRAKLASKAKEARALANHTAPGAVRASGSSTLATPFAATAWPSSKEKASGLKWIKTAARKVVEKNPRGEVPIRQEDHLDSPASAVDSSIDTPKMAQVPQMSPSPGSAGPVLGSAPQGPRPPQIQRSPLNIRTSGALSPQRAASLAPRAGAGAGAPGGNAVNKMAADLDKGSTWPPGDDDDQYLKDKRKEQESNSVTKVAALAIECGLEEYQALQAAQTGANLAKHAGFFSTAASKIKGLLPKVTKAIGTSAPTVAKAKPLMTGAQKAKLLVGAAGTAAVGAGLYAGKKTIDTAAGMTKHRRPTGARTTAFGQQQI